MSSIDKIEQQIETNRRTFRQQAEAIEKDPDLRPEGKRARIAKLQTAANEKHAELRRQYDEAVTAQQKTLYAGAFHRGVGSIDSYRDVYSRVYAVEKPGELRKLHDQALRTNDPVLAKACWQVACDKNLISVMPNDGPDAVAALVNFEHEHGLRRAGDDQRTRQFEQRLAESAKLSAPYHDKVAG